MNSLKLIKSMDEEICYDDKKETSKQTCFTASSNGPGILVHAATADNGGGDRPRTRITLTFEVGFCRGTTDSPDVIVIDAAGTWERDILAATFRELGEWLSGNTPSDDVEIEQHFLV